MGNQRNIPVIAQGVSLDAANRELLKTHRQRIFAEDQFVRAFGVLDSSPHIISFAELDRRFEQVAVKNGAIL